MGGVKVFHPVECGGGGGGEEGGTKSFGEVLAQVLEVLAMMKGGGALCKRREGHEQFNLVLRGGDTKSFEPVILSFCSPPPRN